MAYYSLLTTHYSPLTTYRSPLTTYLLPTRPFFRLIPRKPHSKNRHNNGRNPSSDQKRCPKILVYLPAHKPHQQMPDQHPKPAHKGDQRLRTGANVRLRPAIHENLPGHQKTTDAQPVHRYRTD